MYVICTRKQPKNNLITEIPFEYILQAFVLVYGRIVLGTIALSETSQASKTSICGIGRSGKLYYSESN
jgi:hypothetical protein